MFFYNRYTYSNKHIDIKYFHSNLSQNTIKAITPSSSILDGDNFIIENYLAEYVNVRESVIPQDHTTKDVYIRAFTETSLLASYFHSSEQFLNNNPSLLRHVYVQRILKLDDTLFQIHYLVSEKKDYRTSPEIRKQMIATIRYRFADIPEYDMRLKIMNFDILNPLKIEIVVYTTAHRIT